ncbi:MAG TPA: hypothetical protein VL527_08260 [Dongiaceae bacterium]|nr:hypothetical protein [Dongiaceae bacterium]
MKRHAAFVRVKRVEYSNAFGTRQSGVAAALCHRSPRRRGFIPRSWWLLRRSVARGKDCLPARSLARWAAELMSPQPDNVFAGTQVVSLVEVRGAHRSLVQELNRDFEYALAETKLPERPDYEAANCFLIKARSEMANHN